MSAEKKFDKFITNNDTVLKEIVRDTFPVTQQFDCLVGYFYFSGFEGLASKLIDVPVRILVGMKAEVNIYNKVNEVENTVQISGKEISTIRSQYFDSLKQVISRTNRFDNADITQSWQIFTEKLKNGTLEIKQTRELNHAKLYLLYYDEKTKSATHNQGKLITGSSNFTYSGLKGRNEVNVRLSDNYDFEVGVEYFNQLWGSGTSLINQENFTEFEQKVASKVWINQIPDPYLMYLRVLEEYFAVEQESGVRTAHTITGTFKDLSYQKDAVVKALQVIKAHNGVIVADVVGLGKSVIASVIANNLGLRTIIIAPPHLEEQWNNYIEKFDFKGRYYSSGAIDKVLEGENLDKEKLIIIDEAHKYRNEESKDYAKLHQLCQNQKVLLLTATPFNNSPSDVYSLIKLFQIPGASTLNVVDNLSSEFKELISKYKKIRKEKDIKEEDKQVADEIAQKLKIMIEPLVIRRSRIDLKLIEEYKKDLQSQGVDFAKVADPILENYELGQLEDVYIKSLRIINPDHDTSKGTFSASKYTPSLYLKQAREKQYSQVIDQENIDFFQNSQKQLAKFMRLLLIKRFESSIFGFISTLNNMIKSHQTTIDWYEKLGFVGIYRKGNLPSVDDMLDGQLRDSDTAEDGEVEQVEKDINPEDIKASLKKLEEKGLEKIYKKDLKNDFIKDVKKDYQLLLKIRELWQQFLNLQIDPKYDRVVEIIKDNLLREPARKIVIFSEYSDTIDYLFERLERDGLRTIKYTSKVAGKELKQNIKANFDAGVAKAKQENDYDIIVATDAISEGYNLHRAGMIINYDIPYNPTRVIQRVGRINRISEKIFDELYIYNFFPSIVGAKDFRNEDLVRLKIRMIHQLLGEDTRVIAEDEVKDLSSFLKEQYKQAEEGEEQISWDTKYQQFLRSIKVNNPDVYEKAKNLPLRSRCARLSQPKTDSSDNLVIVFAKKGQDYTFKIEDSSGIHNISAERGLGLFEAKEGEQGFKISDRFFGSYDKLRGTLFQKDKVQGEKPNSARSKALAFVQELLTAEAIEDKEYFVSLKKAIDELNNIPESFLKFINKLNEDVKGREVEIANQIKSKIPEDYLVRMFNAKNRIEHEPETILLAEEFLNKN